MQCQSLTHRFKICLQRDLLSSSALLKVVLLHMMVSLDHQNCHKMTSTRLDPLCGKSHLEDKVEVTWFEVVCGFDSLVIA